MLLLLELIVVIAAFVLGCWTKGVAKFFLPMIATALTAFAILVGNPVGLLASFGGWIILDVMLAALVLLAHIANLIIIPGS
jgi:hypothetical protein